jgi:hypothetical protein
MARASAASTASGARPATLASDALEGDVLEAGEVPDPTWADSCATRADVEVHNLVCLGGTPTLETASRVSFRETDGLPLSDWLRTECLPVGHPECGEAAPSPRSGLSAAKPRRSS